MTLTGPAGYPRMLRLLKRASELTLLRTTMSSSSSDVEKATTKSVEEVEDPALAAVFSRHGRTDLVPMPSDDPDDPLN